MSYIFKPEFFMAKRITWTVEPAPDVESLMRKRITERAGTKGTKRGLRTLILNECVRNHLAYLNGKRESAV